MAGFGEEGGRGGAFLAPVAAHVAVREVPPADGLGVLDGEDVADGVVGEE